MYVLLACRSRVSGGPISRHSTPSTAFDPLNHTHSSPRPLRPYCHEMALRILLASLEQHAARYKRYIVPVLSLSIDFYIRVFVRVYTSGAPLIVCTSKICDRIAPPGAAQLLPWVSRLSAPQPGKQPSSSRFHACDLPLPPPHPSGCSGRGEELRHAAGLRVAVHRLRLLLLAAGAAAGAQGMVVGTSRSSWEAAGKKGCQPWSSEACPHACCRCRRPRLWEHNARRQ